MAGSEAGDGARKVTVDISILRFCCDQFRRDSIQPGFIPDSTGRLLCYNQTTNEVSVLMSGLSGGGGPAVSSDGTFVLVPEIGSFRISKYWLVGP